MPYIKQEERNEIDKELNKFLNYVGVMTPGEFVYVMYQIAQWQASKGGIQDLPADWTTGSRVVADMECAKLEFYRRVMAPYEEHKINENGDCTPPRSNRKSFKNFTNRRPMWNGKGEVTNPRNTDVVVGEQEW